MNLFIIFFVFAAFLCFVEGCGTTAGGVDLTRLSSLIPLLGTITDFQIAEFLTTQLNKLLKGNIKVSEYQGNPDSTPVTCGSGLADCDFSNRGADCRWHNVKGEDKFQYFLGEGQAGVEEFETYFGVPEQPTEPFLLTAANKGPKTSTSRFVSPPIIAMESAGVLSLKLWATALVEVEVCTRPVGSTRFTQCSRKFDSGDGPGPVQADIPPSSGDFEIVIVSGNFVTSPGSLVFLDDIRLSCDGSGSATQAPSGGPLCDVLACGFETSCAWQLDGSGGSFEVTQGVVGNPHTAPRFKSVMNRIDDTDPYLLATGLATPATFKATSPVFDSPAPRRLAFWRYQATENTELSVCTATNQCTSYTDIARAWREELVELPAGNGQVTFEATGLTLNGYLAIDDIRIQDAQGNLEC